MPTIGADAHVIETENTWNYLEGHESKAALKTDHEIPLNEVADFSVLSEVQKELKLTRE